MLFQKPLYEWRKPKLLKDKWSDIFRMVAKLYLRAYLAAMILVALVYAYLESISSGEFDNMWDHIFLRFIPGSFAFIVFMAVIGTIQCTFDSVTYQIREKGIHSSGSSSWFLRWPTIQGFWVEPSEKYEEIYFAVFLTGWRRRRMPLPQDKELRECILQTLSQRIPQVPPVEEVPRYVLSDLQMIFMALFTLAYCYTLAYICSSYIPAGEGDNFYNCMAVMLLIFIFGPGTLGMAILVKGRWSEFKKYIHSAFAFNFLSFGVFIFIFILLLIRPYLELAGQG